MQLLPFSFLLPFSLCFHPEEHAAGSKSGALHCFLGFSHPRSLNEVHLCYLRSAARIMDPKEKPENTSGPRPRRLDCIKCFDALWFCYSPLHQMQYYYRYGDFDNCFGKWGDLVDCLTLKTKRASEVEEILIAREKAKPHIWTFRTVDEAAMNWWRMNKHAVITSMPESGPAKK